MSAKVAAVSPVSRRIFLYWVLLLVPTLVVGGGALVLLWREQERLVKRGEYADAAREAAVTARARLIAENVELLVGDVQTGLLEALAIEPEAGLDGFLAEWERTNPLVRTAFRATADGRMLRPQARAGSEDERGFLRRFAKQFGNRPPWSTAPLAKTASEMKREQDLAKDEAGRAEVSRNVANVQSARRDVQELLRNSQSNFEPAPVAASAGLSDGVRGERSAGATPSAPSARQSRDVERESEARSRGAGVAQSVAPAAQRMKDVLADRRGWVPTTSEGRLQLLGWVQPGGAGEVRGVEVQIAELVRRLAGALPVDVGSGEGYALRDDQGRVLHQAGAIPGRGAAATRVPLAAALLPGWDVVAYVAPTGEDFRWSVGWWLVAMLLVIIFVVAILAGGSLLLWQARRSEAEAAQKTSFVANVSHEFKTPLTTIRLYSELLEQGRVRDGEQGREYLRTIGRETQRLARLVNNALDFSRLEQGRKKFARDEIELGAELGRLLDTHEPRVAEAGLALRRELPSEPVRVTTDRDALQQIVLNLIDNACKYAAEGGEVRVGVTARAEGGAEVRVGDRGPGVPAEHRERVFEKFHRVDEALTAEKSGAGLGLSIARQLARGMGGELRCEARAGGGAEFVLELK